MTYTDSYVGNFTVAQGTVGAGGTVAGLIDKIGGTGSVSGGLLIMKAVDDSSYYQNFLYDPNSNTKRNQKVVVRTPANLDPGFAIGLHVRATYYSDRIASYQMLFADSLSGPNNPYFRLVRINRNAGGPNIAGSASPVGWYNPTHSYRFEFKAEGSFPTTLTATVTDVTTSTLMATLSVQDSTETSDEPHQTAGYAGIQSSIVESNKYSPTSAWAVSNLNVLTEPIVPPVGLGNPTLVSRSSGQNVISAIASGGTAPYSVQFHRMVDNWSYTPNGSTVIGSPVSVATDGGAATFTDSTAQPGVFYIYKAVVTDAVSASLTATGYLFVEGLRTTPGTYPTLRPNIVSKGILLAQYGDSISSTGYINENIRTFLQSKGVTVQRTANAGFQGSGWFDWRSDAGSVAVQEGAVNTNIGASRQLYAAQFGGSIPGVNPLQKAFYITDYEIGLAPAGTQLVISTLLGMNDLLQNQSGAQILANATNIINAIKTKYPTALIVINHPTWAHPGVNGPGSSVNYTNSQAGWNNIKTLADNTKVFIGDESNWYFFYKNFAGVPGDAGGPLFQGGDQPDFATGSYDHVHILPQGDSYAVSNARTPGTAFDTGAYGQGPAIRRTALKSAQLPGAGVSNLGGLGIESTKANQLSNVSTTALPDLSGYRLPMAAMELLKAGTATQSKLINLGVRPEIAVLLV